MERCCILWRKRGKRGKHLEDEADEQEAHEAQEADDFVQLVTPRALSVLLSLAKHSEHHCALTVPAVRHVWPFLESQDVTLSNVSFRYDTLSLLYEWSQCSISAKPMAEFAARYPNHVQMLIDVITTEKKEDALPPGKVAAICCHLLSLCDHTMQSGRLLSNVLKHEFNIKLLHADLMSAWFPVFKNVRIFLVFFCCFLCFSSILAELLNPMRSSIYVGFQDNAKKAVDFLELGSEASMQKMLETRRSQNPNRWINEWTQTHFNIFSLQVLLKPWAKPCSDVLWLRGSLGPFVDASIRWVHE